MGSNVRKVLKEDNKKIRKEDNKKPVKQGNRKWASPLAFQILFIAFFVLLAWYFLYVRNADLMFFMQDRGWWNSTSLFFKDCISVPGGILAWAGSYLTQYFYYPALGCTMLILLWLLTFFVAKWSFRVPREWSFLLFIPLSALLCSIIQLGYWIYILKDVDYVFYHSLGLLAALLLSLPLWQYLPVSDKVKRWATLLWIPLVAALFYYPLGIYALLAATIVAVRRLSFNLQSSIINVVLLALTLWLVPLLETSGTTVMRPDQPWMYGFHKFILDELRDISLEIPFYIALIAPLFFPFIKKIRIEKLWLRLGIMVVVAAAMTYSLFARDFKDYNFHAELRMQRGVEECRWNDVLREAGIVKGPVTREMVMFRDIALINRGELCSKRYLYNNESIPPALASDSIHIRIADQAGDLIYYNFGETIFAIRRAIERCMHYGYSYYTMRILTQCALVNGEKDNARKYLRLLSRTTFQKKWAEKMLPFLEDEQLMLTDEHFRMPLKLYNEGSELVGIDDKYVELTIMNKWMYSITNDPEAQEVALGCAMMARNQNCFWAQVQQFYNINPGKYFPLHVQEAMLFGVYELKMEGINLSFVKFDQRVIDRYQAFFERINQYSSQGMNDKQIGAALRPEFGDTYMWDYYVLREVQTN
ncbi:MAG: hypothetical protein IJT11_01085 [Bacteroidaceae bacterium]|nr:hypothetical protein [Bacteroidaceae bacterium]